MQVNDKVQDVANGEVAVVTGMHTHYFLVKSQQQQPYSDPIAVIQYVESGHERMRRVSKLRKVEP